MLQPLARYYQKHKTRIHRLSREGGWIVAGQIASVVGALVLIRVLTEYLNPAQYGDLALGLTVAGLVNQIVMGGLTAGIGRYYSIAAEKQNLGGYFHSTFFLLAYATAVVIVIGLTLVASLYWLGYSQWIGLAGAALVYSTLSGYNGVLTGIQSAARQRAIVAFHGGLDAWLRIGLAVGGILWLGNSSTAVVIGYAFSSLLIIGSQLMFLRRTIPSQSEPVRNSREWVTQIWVYSLPFTTFGAFTWIQQVSDRWALHIFATSKEVGQYAVLFQLGYTPIAMVSGMAMSFLGPILYQRSGDATDKSRNTNVHQIGWKMTQLSLFVTLLAFSITFALHEWLFNMLVALEYRENTHLLPWVVMAGGIFAAGQMLALKLMSEMKPAAMTSAKIGSALIGTLSNLIGSMLFGLQGVVWAMLVFSGIYFMWMAVLANRAFSSAIKA